MNVVAAKLQWGSKYLSNDISRLSDAGECRLISSCQQVPTEDTQLVNLLNRIL